MVFKELKEEDLVFLEEWYKDEEVLKRLGGTLPLNRWFCYVQQNNNYYAWIVHEDIIPAGQVALELYPDCSASISILINPSYRNNGFGQKILKALLQKTELSAVQIIKVGIETDNVASLQCFKKVGFIEEGLDMDGLIALSYTP